MTPRPAGPSERAVLSRELADLLVELSIALHKHAMYPPEHPALPPAASALVDRIEHLLADRPTISLGVARHQLVIEGVATDPKHPVLHELAERLHRHHLGAVTFSRGLTVAEVRDALQVLAVEPDRGGKPLGLGPPDALQRWAHLRLYPLTYERLELLDEAAAADPETRSARARAAQLWVGLARAALAAEDGDASPPSTEPAVIARAIDERAPEAAGAYDQAIVGYLLQIADELKGAGSSEAATLRRRMSHLVRSMKPETLRRLVEMGGDMAQRRRFVADAADGMAVDAVMEILRAAAEASHQTISHSLVRMLAKLAAHAEGGSADTRARADAELRDQVRRLIAGWTLQDPNPGAYRTALEHMAGSGPGGGSRAADLAPPEPERLAAMGLELDMTGPAILEAADRIVAAGRLQHLLEALEGMPEASAAAGVLWQHVATHDTVHRLVAQHPLDFPVLDRLVPRVGVAAAEPLLDALATAEVRGERRGLLGLLAHLGPGIGPLVVSRLRDERWYVTRNLLGLLDEIGTPPAGFSAMPWLKHADGRVRWQALKLQLKLGADRDQALVAALRDADPRVAQLALMATLADCPETILPLVTSRATDRTAAAEVRLLAIRALGGVRAPAARATLLGLTFGGRTLFGREKLPPKSPELLAALGALAAGWGQDPTARRVLARAARSRDPEIRRTATTTSAPIRE
jgi:hypothetical protein